MDNFPDFTSYGYQVIEQIKSPTLTGQFIGKAKNLKTNKIGLIKQFRFATPNSTWSRYKAYQQEITILQNLHHSRIPQYLDSFETADSFCLVLEYIEAKNLAQNSNFTIPEIKLVTKKVLEILVYLQQQEPPIIHQNIKPENILIDAAKNVYLIDFGLGTRLNIKDENNLSLTLGTPGFIAPEQAIAPTKSSDLYSLGVTIICLLTNKKSEAIVELITPERPNQIQFQTLTANVDSAFVSWLQKMVEPQVKQRFADARSALEALQEIDWELPDNTVNILSESLPNNLPLSLQLYGFSTLGMAILAMMTVIGLQIMNLVTDKTTSNITIALIGMIVIYIAQYAAATALKTASEGKSEAIVLAIATPLTLTIAAGVIMGRGEAVAMSVAATIAQTATLISVLWQKLTLETANNLLKIIGLFLATAVGVTFGLIF